MAVRDDMSYLLKYNNKTGDPIFLSEDWTLIQNNQYKKISTEDFLKAIQNRYTFEDWDRAKFIADQYYGPKAVALTTLVSEEYLDETYEDRIYDIVVRNEDGHEIDFDLTLPGFDALVEDYKNGWELWDGSKVPPLDRRNPHQWYNDIAKQEYIMYAVKDFPAREITYDLCVRQEKAEPEIYVRVQTD